MADITPQKTTVIILDMAKGYGWKPGSFGYEMVAQVRQLKDAAYAAGVQVLSIACAVRRTTSTKTPA